MVIAVPRNPASTSVASASPDSPVPCQPKTCRTSQPAVGCCLGAAVALPTPPATSTVASAIAVSDRGHSGRDRRWGAAEVSVVIGCSRGREMGSDVVRRSG